MRYKNVVDNENKKLLDTSEISLRLDDYDDIFSDFDPRPYSQKALSVDFLEELKRASVDKKFGAIQLIFLVPLSKKNSSFELMIKKRLREHFKKHYRILKEEVKKTIRKGIVFMISGIILMVTATFLLFSETDKNLIKSFFITLLEPASWFLFWEGGDIALFEPKEKKLELEFYKKMANSRIIFYHY
ncbi:MAG: hypothetical protein QXG86_02830 [Candidatus Woesearchaeota archaeon]